jgi:hypothetical protein
MAFTGLIAPASFAFSPEARTAKIDAVLKSLIDGKSTPGIAVLILQIPYLEDQDNLMLLNPGSPTDRRRQPHHTFALLRAEGGGVRAQIQPLQL